MNISTQQKKIIKHIVNVFETGKPEGNYSAISRYDDGPGRIRQVTYGCSQTTEYGHLHELIELYVQSNGTYSAKLKPFVDKIGHTPLVDNDEFLKLLKDAGSDPVMQKAQDDFFDRFYFQPAMKWADNNGFIKALSALVIYDSHIHSGSIPSFLRKRFPASVPADGGNEKDWIAQYVSTRENWLKNHSNQLLHKTVYRTQCFQHEIDRDNWDLSQLPISANGVNVSK